MNGSVYFQKMLKMILTLWGDDLFNMTFPPWTNVSWPEAGGHSMAMHRSALPPPYPFPAQ